MMDNLFDLAEELINNKEEGDTEISGDAIKIYPSPLPFQRHIESLNMSSPNPALIPALLEGNETLKGGYIKLYHGPPGTGKTFRLMKELTKIIDNEKFHRILVCAPSNIATCNMYRRAKKMGIKATLVISDSKIPDDLKKDSKLWKPNSDKLVFSTISMRFGRLLREQKFTTILIDEAAQCQEAWMWGLLRQEVKYVHMAGDPHQLPALVSDKGNKLEHGRSLMERLMDLEYPSELLDTQRRMHPIIAEFSNITFYDGKLKNDYNSKVKIDPFIIYNIEGNEERVGTSYKNRKEADKLIEIYHQLKQELNQVIIISPYLAQCQLINQLDPEIEVHTVDSFQGREADGVIMTTVRSGNSVGFWNNYQRLNVGLTRAKHALRIVGKISTWEKEDGPLKKLANYANQNNLINNKVTEVNVEDLSI